MEDLNTGLGAAAWTSGSVSPPPSLDPPLWAQLPTVKPQNMLHWPRPELVPAAHEGHHKALDEYC